MKKIIDELFGVLGLSGSPLSLRIAIIWCAIGLCLLLSCDYESSAWYALPILVGNMVISLMVLSHLYKAYRDER